MTPPNKTDAVTFEGYLLCVSNVLRSTSPDPGV